MDPKLAGLLGLVKSVPDSLPGCSGKEGGVCQQEAAGVASERDEEEE